MENSRTIAQGSTFNFVINDYEHGMRLDKYLSTQFPYYSRSFLQGLIEQDCISINGKIIHKTSTHLKCNDQICVIFPPAREIQATISHNCPIDVELIYEHEHFLILGKPANLIVHRPNTSSTECTLVDWILKSYKEIASIGDADRPGIVHRLDKDTSGVIIIPRTQYAHTAFGHMFQQRTIHKTYWALVTGHPDKTGTIDLPIGRCLKNKTKMATYNPSIYTSTKVRQSLTHYTVLEYFEDCSLVEVKPVTGRTHQIRVHMAAIGHPIIGDTVYGTTSHLINRQALHAHTITFDFDAKSHTFTATLPTDFFTILEKLRNKGS